MPRATNAAASRKRRKRILKRAKGFVGGRHRLMGVAREAVQRAWRYSFTGRKTRKRDFRSLWIVRINAAARMHGSTYRDFVHGLKLAGIDLDRKQLAELAVSDDAAFGRLVTMASDARARRSA